MTSRIYFFLVLFAVVRGLRFNVLSDPFIGCKSLRVSSSGVFSFTLSTSSSWVVISLGVGIVINFDIGFVIGGFSPPSVGVWSIGGDAEDVASSPSGVTLSISRVCFSSRSSTTGSLSTSPSGVTLSISRVCFSSRSSTAGSLSTIC